MAYFAFRPSPNAIASSSAHFQSPSLRTLEYANSARDQQNNRIVSVDIRRDEKETAGSVSQPTPHHRAVRSPNKSRANAVSTKPDAMWKSVAGSRTQGAASPQTDVVAPITQAIRGGLE